MHFDIDLPESNNNSEEELSCTESRHDRFLRIAERRVNKILSDFELLQNCSAPTNYEYTDDEVERLLSAITDKLEETRFLFTRGKKKKEKFTF